jgi:predicted transcriptional regulator of viral defense system
MRADLDSKDVSEHRDAGVAKHPFRTGTAPGCQALRLRLVSSIDRNNTEQYGFSKRTTPKHMSCSDLPEWYLRNRVAVLDVQSATFQRARDKVMPTGYNATVCLRRLVEAARIRRIRGGLYVVLDPARATPAIAVASGAFAEVAHYVTTDAALAHHGLLDQPITTITVVLSRVRRSFAIDPATTLRPVTLDEDRIGKADAYQTTVEGLPIRIASREQAVVDALAEPRWMTYGDLLPEILAAFSDDELERTAGGTLARTTAAAQRLGYLLEEAQRPLPSALASLRPVRAIRLRPQNHSRGPYSTRWRVYG